MYKPPTITGFRNVRDAHDARDDAHDVHDDAHDDAHDGGHVKR